MTWKLRLYVAGQTPKSSRAFANLKVLCEEHLKGRHRFEVIDLLEHPDMARGDLSTTDRALVGLALQQVV